MLHCATVLHSDFGGTNFGQLNMASVIACALIASGFFSIGGNAPYYIKGSRKILENVTVVIFIYI
jgi:hypothetical protein